MKVGDCHDEDLRWIDVIYQAIRKAFQEIASVVAFVGRPKPGKLLNPLQSFLNFIEELISKTALLCFVVGSCSTHFLVSIVWNAISGIGGVHVLREARGRPPL
jgi:hypothetical protein